ncbi:MULTISPECIES: hypothetical protein [unclassified Streptomyces]|uniref:hypothetical protein n=1 Tax=unclassified Streptomyces TaxID=2593676 RepID=UPI0028C500AB|nr:MULTISPECIES: hypothetical protein [unclassified Streptomyces]WNO75441.1 hypothetical protein RPQ07_29205 [Streptomyces sp. AM8-1-1]
MHTYDPSRQPYTSQIPSMRPAREASGSPTPIYDALYSEYRRSFRTLPGDRSGEEDLGFKAFGTGLSSSRGSGFAAAAQPVHPGGGWPPYPGSSAHGGNPYPAALPPAPRRGI